MEHSNYIFDIIQDPSKTQQRKYQREYRARNKEKCKEYRLKNKSRIAIYQKRYYARKIEARNSSLNIADLTPVKIVCHQFSIEGLSWYDTIRTKILNGISTNTLPEIEQDNFWLELNKRVAEKYPFMCGNHTQKRS